MASVWKAPKSPYWQARFKKAGKWVNRSTKVTAKAKAMRIAFQWEEEAERDEAPDILPGTIGEALEAYLVHMKATRAESTVKDWGYVYPRVFMDLDQPLAKVTGVQVDKAIEAMGVSQGSMNQYSRKIKTFFNWLVRGEWIEKAPHLEKRSIKDTDRVWVRTVYRPAELKKLFADTHKLQKRKSLTGSERSFLYQTAYTFALRVGELTKLTPVDILYPIRGQKPQLRIIGKGGKVSDLPMPDQYFEQLEDWLFEQDIDPDGTDPIFKFDHRHATAQLLYPDMTELNIPVHLNGRIRNFHSFRKTRISDLANDNMPVNLLQAFARHADVKTTLSVYTEAHPDKMRDFI